MSSDPRIDDHTNTPICTGCRSVSLTDPHNGRTVHALVFDSLGALKRAVVGSGSHWFDPGTMVFFGTIMHDLIGGCVFITGESTDPDTPDRYTLRYVASEPDNAGRLIVGDLGGFGRYDTAEAARKAARVLLYP